MTKDPQTETDEAAATVATIESAIKEASAHLQKLRLRAPELQQLRPITAATLTSIDDPTTLKLDQFVYRFTKLQDAMARRLLPSLYAWLESDAEPRAFLDILNRLEQIEVIPSVATWQKFRTIRNSIAHDYPESLDRTANTLNELLADWHELEGMYLAAVRAYRSRG